MKWVKTEDELPKEEGIYIVWTRGKWETARWLCEQWCFHKDILNKEYARIDYWLNIEAPEVDDEL